MLELPTPPLPTPPSPSLDTKKGVKVKLNACF